MVLVTFKILRYGKLCPPFSDQYLYNTLDWMIDYYFYHVQQHYNYIVIVKFALVEKSNDILTTVIQLYEVHLPMNNSQTLKTFLVLRCICKSNYHAILGPIIK